MYLLYIVHPKNRCTVNTSCQGQWPIASFREDTENTAIQVPWRLFILETRQWCANKQTRKLININMETCCAIQGGKWGIYPWNLSLPFLHNLKKTSDFFLLLNYHWVFLFVNRNYCAIIWNLLSSTALRAYLIYTETFSQSNIKHSLNICPSLLWDNEILCTTAVLDTYFWNQL